MKNFPSLSVAVVVHWTLRRGIIQRWGWNCVHWATITIWNWNLVLHWLFQVPIHYACCECKHHLLIYLIKHIHIHTIILWFAVLLQLSVEDTILASNGLIHKWCLICFLRMTFCYYLQENYLVTFVIFRHSWVTICEIKPHVILLVLVLEAANSIAWKQKASQTGYLVSWKIECIKHPCMLSKWLITSIRSSGNKNIEHPSFLAILIM